jgi:hypothetical protein
MSNLLSYHVLAAAVAVALHARPAEDLQKMIETT